MFLAVKFQADFMTDNGSLLPHLKDSLELAHLARSQHFTENQHFLPPLTY